MVDEITIDLITKMVAAILSTMLFAIVIKGLFYVLLVILGLIIIAIYYIVSAMSISKIAADNGIKGHRIFAWIPFARIVLLYEIIGRPISPWWGSILSILLVLVISLIIPYLVLFLIVLMWTFIIYMYMKSWWKAALLGILLGWPGLNIVIAFYFAYIHKYLKPKDISTAFETIFQ